jgi:hypothetical protein
VIIQPAGRLYGGGLAASGGSIRKLYRVQRKLTVLCTGFKRTRHPRKGAVEEPKVTVREPQWNERSTADDRENTGVYRLLWVNVHGISD